MTSKLFYGDNLDVLREHIASESGELPGACDDRAKVLALRGSPAKQMLRRVLDADPKLFNKLI